MNIKGDQTQHLLTRMLDSTAMRDRVLANNVANADTPGYIRQDVAFQGELADAVKSGTLNSYSPQVQADHTAPAKADGNNVAVDRELAELNKNAMMHQMAVQLMQAKLSMERIAITGRT